MPQKLAKAVRFAAILWPTGLVRGIRVFMMPAPKNTAPIPYGSSNRRNCFPILLDRSPDSFVLAKHRPGTGMRCFESVTAWMGDAVVGIMPHVVGGRLGAR